MLQVKWRFPRSSTLCPHSPPWTGSLCQETSLRSWTAPWGRGTGRARHHIPSRDISLPGRLIPLLESPLPEKKQEKELIVSCITERQDVEMCRLFWVYIWVSNTANALQSTRGVFGQIPTWFLRDAAFPVNDIAASINAFLRLCACVLLAVEQTVLAVLKYHQK